MFNVRELKAMITGLETVVDFSWNSDDEGDTVEKMLGLSEGELGQLFGKLKNLRDEEGE